MSAITAGRHSEAVQTINAITFETNLAERQASDIARAKATNEVWLGPAEE